MADELMTVEAFVLDRGLSMSYEKTATNPCMADSTDMDHWMVTIHHPAGRSLTPAFSMGKGHKGSPPLIEDVLGRLAMDAASYENAPTFEEWAADFGMDADRRKAEKIHRIIGEQSQHLKHLLGREDYEILLFKTERR